MEIKQYSHFPNVTELGFGNTHESYFYIGSEYRDPLSDFFPNEKEIYVYDINDITKGYIVKAKIGNEFRINQLGEIYSDYDINPGDKLTFTKIKTDNTSKVFFKVEKYNRVYLSVSNRGTEIYNIDRLSSLKENNKYVIDINGSYLEIEFDKSEKKRRDSPETTDYYKTTIGDKSLRNGDYFLTIESKGCILEQFKKSEYSCFSIDENNSTTPSLPTPTNLLDFPLQQIFYGAPGTGKSHSINEITKKYDAIRTTFHPDSDYSTFVGAYKPVMDDVRKCVVIDKEEKEVKPLDGGSEFERRITYKFIKQAFLKAYISAWKGLKENKPVLLVIEEINRGNCAQIFGDIFQLLDRDESGYSSYSIDADDDIQRELNEEFKESNIDIEEIKNGTKLLLPPNLYIWATMNTSDQSLFPIDSAFKRRWDWKYVKIKDEGKGWTIANTDKTDWWDFLKAVNRVINEMTSSADKQLGYFFCKPKKNETEISAETFVGKVIFYLWNDVFKDYGFDDTTLFRYNDSEGRSVEISFPSFYDEDGEKINKDVMDKFIQNVLNWRKDKESEQN